jgi:hypothetical protein
MTTDAYLRSGGDGAVHRVPRHSADPAQDALVWTRSATAASGFARDMEVGVFSRSEVLASGCTDSALRSRLAAGRWQRVGRAVVLHNGELTREQRWRVAVVNCGPRAVLTSFSAAEMLGLRGWERDEVHVLAPAGVPEPRLPGLPVVLHRTSRPIRTTAAGQCHALPAAFVLAASSFRTARPACGILAAAVQQRLVTAAALRSAVDDAPRTRHRRVLRAVTDDIEMGAQALSEIDFVALCRRNRLPVPGLQAVRLERDGRRRYLDAEWIRRDGRRVAAEVDGALHLAPRRWFDDQLRQNEVVIGGTLMLRYPSVVIRTEEPLVVDQLARALFARS